MSKTAVEKKINPLKTTRIMIFGTFDGVHEGHLNLFKQARALAKTPFLIASIARDKNVFKIKGEYPTKNEKARLLLLKQNKFIDKAVLGGKNYSLTRILKEKPEIIALGYDQKSYVKELKKDLKNKGIFIKIVRLKPYKEKIYKNHLLKKKKNF
jgi:FAD synthetase